jgi:hypothetical protein
MQFENGIISESLRVFLERKITVSTVFGVMIVIGYLESFVSSKTGFNFAFTFVMSMLAVTVHKTVILGTFDERSVADTKVIFAYVWRIIAMTLLSLIPAIVAFVLLTGMDKNISIGIAVLVWAICYLFLLGLFGTCLPAIAVAGDKSWTSAFHRGRSTLGYVLTRLTFLNGSLLFVLYAAIGTMAVVLKHRGLISTNDYPLWFSLPTNLVATLVSIFAAVMASTILSRAYLIAEGIDSAPLGGRRVDIQSNWSAIPNSARTATPTVKRTQPMFGARR